MQGARGSGKTRTGAEVFAELILTSPPGEWGVIAPTFGDARDTCVEGESGLKGVLGPAVSKWNRSNGELYIANGSIVHLDGADDGALRIQGKNLRGAWCDEIGLWKKWQTSWEESLQFAVRVEPAKIIATGTPKGKHGIVKLLLEEAATAPQDVIFSRTFLEDNERNLAPAQIASLRRRYEGTRLGHQELGGEILDEVEGALWTWKMIDEHRVGEDPVRIGHRSVVAVDPSGSKEGDEVGIVCVATDHTQAGYVLEDRSGNYSPLDWAKAAVALYHDRRADRIVVERNFGGEMAVTLIRQVDPNVPILTVFASKGKEARAEPVAALYEQGRVHHVGVFPELESEQTSWVPGAGKRSPNRLDALVWAFTDLILDLEPAIHVGGEVQPFEDGVIPPTITGDLWGKRF